MFEILGKRFLFSVDTLRSYELDEEAWALVKLCRQFFEQNQGVDGEEELLQYLGPHFQKSKAVALLREIEAIPVLNTTEKSSTQSQPVSLEFAVFNVSHSCNMICEYCCVEKGRFGGEEMMMTKEIARQAVDFIIKYYRKGEIALGFFGGEPLLNFNTLRFIVEYTKSLAQEMSKTTNFHLTTNATLLSSEIIEFLDENDFNMIVSLDGPEHIHDQMRRFKNGTGTFKTVFANLERLRSTSLASRTSLQSTYVNGSTELLDRLTFLDELVGDGYGCAFSVEPVMLLPNDSQYVFASTQFQELEPDYNRYARIFLDKLRRGNPTRFFHFCAFLRRLRTQSKIHRECGGGTSYFVINPDGKLFGCHMEREAHMGDIYSGFDEPARAGWLKESVDEKNDCKACWARYVCGGGCELEYLCSRQTTSFTREFRCRLKRHLSKLAVWIMSEMDSRGTGQAGQKKEGRTYDT
jgi:uncharacterized protein